MAEETTVNTNTERRCSSHLFKLSGAAFFLIILTFFWLSMLPNSKPYILTRPRQKECLQNISKIENEITLNISTSNNVLCPSGGRYNTDSSGISCSIHGKANTPRLPDRETDISLYIYDPIILSGAVIVIMWNILIIFLLKRLLYTSSKSS